MIKRVPWFRNLKKTDPEPPLRLPIACGPVSNGEGWWPDSARKRLIRKLVNEKAEEVSRREGIDRREFMASACGMATTLYVINMVNGCSTSKPPGHMPGPGVGAPLGGSAGGIAGGAGSVIGAGTGGGAAGGSGSSGSSGGGSGSSGGSGDGGFQVPEDAMVDPELAECLMQGKGELIIDMQSHFATPETNPLGAAGLAGFIGQINNTRYPWIQRTPGCSEATCYDRQEYIEQILMGSDTTIGVLSGISYSLGIDGTGTGSFAALTNEDLKTGAEYLAQMYPGRILTHCMVMPNDRIDIQLDMMTRNAGSYTNWKTYPPWSPDGNGYWLNEGVGPQMIQKGLDLGAAIFCIHKGFPLTSFSPVYTDPKDVGPAARMFPNAHLVIYHSAFEHGLAPGESTQPDLNDPNADVGWGPGVGMWPEGPYSETDTAIQEKYPLTRGVNSLIKSLRASNIGPNGWALDGSNAPRANVYAECGGVWPNLLMGRVEEAMHYWGKLLLHLGEERIVWGTDCLWFGSPQPVIQAFRMFEISQEFQDRYGYPPLTQRAKELILGQNAARLQAMRGMDVRGKCHEDVVGATALRHKREIDQEFGARRDMMVNVWGPRTRREFLSLRRHEHEEKVRWSGRIPANRG